MKGFRNNIIYSKKYIKELKLVLGDYKKFIKSTIAKRRVISNKMKQLFSVENLSRIFENPEQIEYSLKNLDSILKTERKNIVYKIDTLLQKVPTRSNCSSFIKSFELVLCSFNDILLEKYDIKLDEDVSKK